MHELSTNDLLNELWKKQVKIGDEWVKIWDTLFSDPKKHEVLEQFVERWEDRKRMSEQDWYSKKEYYPKFYNELYKPLMDDIALYKQKSPNCKYPDFWAFFFSQYFYNSKQEYDIWKNYLSNYM